MTGVADSGTGDRRPARRPLGPLKLELFEGKPHKLALVQHLRSLVVAADLASKHVAPRVNTSPSNLSRILAGERLPARTTLEAIVQLCEVTDEVRAELLRLHTAALGEVNPQLAECVVKADAYEETVLLHDRVQARLETATAEHRRQQADYEDLLARHETTRQAFTAAEDELREQRQHHQQETARLSSLLQEEQDARHRDRTAFEAQLHQAHTEQEAQLRGREEEEARLRQNLLAQENQIQAVRGLLEESAAEVTALRRERDHLRLESARLREDLVGLQVDLAAAEAEPEHHRSSRQDTAPALRGSDKSSTSTPPRRRSGKQQATRVLPEPQRRSPAILGGPCPPRRPVPRRLRSPRRRAAGCG
ncbi:helix-turn-helix domain-containing protein [Streptomyces sp. ISL-44]|uniref:helix-turn-helix domain-containing protein n=1 Tax=Streptomyces sp. ISL-44 TaxID=2819184 RepID=UPI001BE60EA0|nr:helix-turn-helix domain-containing protein [Streptomyces sp. ISL-44]MBT2546386.1 helix-turn-helix domain-containing protein [Streptomyces sp. ISL-44]